MVFFSSVAISSPKASLLQRALLNTSGKESLRIFPGYIVNSIVCIFLVAPFVGAGLSVFHPHALLFALLRMLRLALPEAVGTFPDRPFSGLNGSAWTISYEFKCYIMAAILGSIGAFQRKFRVTVLVCVLICLLLNALQILPETAGAMTAIFGDPPRIVRFSAIFGAGMLFYLLREHIVYEGKFVSVAGSLLIPLMYNTHTAEFALTILGGYIVFWFAFKYRVLSISIFTNKTDLSYGIYLYAWPISKIRSPISIIL